MAEKSGVNRNAMEDFKFNYAFLRGGVDCVKIEIEMPTYHHQRRAIDAANRKYGNNDRMFNIETECQMIMQMAGLAEDELRSIRIPDYTRLVEKLQGFLGTPNETVDD